MSGVPHGVGGGAAVSGYLRGALVEGVCAHVFDKVLASPESDEVLRSLPPWMRQEFEKTRQAIQRAAREYEQMLSAADEKSGSRTA